MKPNKDIDRGEVWAAVLGASCVLSKEIERVTAAQKRAVLSVQVDTERRAKLLVTDGLSATYSTVPKYDYLDDALQRGLDVDQVQAMIAKLPSDDQLPYMTIASRQYEFLSHGFPRASWQTLAGFVAVQPDPVLWYRFQGLYRVINNPFDAFGLMADGALLQNQAMAIRAVYPTLSGLFDRAIQGAIADQKAKNAKYEVPYRADQGIRDWLGMEVAFKPYQAAYVPGSEKMTGEAAPPTSGVAPESKASLSAAQSALYGNVGR